MGQDQHQKQTDNSLKPMGYNEGSPEREVHSNAGLPKKDGNTSDKHPNLTDLQQLEEQNKQSPE